MIKMYPPTPVFNKTETHTKGWGEEVWLFNEDFCGKLLIFKKPSTGSLHGHKNKREGFLIMGGKFNIHFVDASNAQISSHIMNPGDTVYIPPMLFHRIECIEPGTIVEFSTHHEDEDSYRILPGASQNN